MKRNIAFTLLLLFSIFLLIGCTPTQPVVDGMPAEGAVEEVFSEPTTGSAEVEGAEEAIEEAAASPVVEATPRAPEDLADGFFISMTTDDIDRAAMAVGFATKIRKNTDRPVTIFFNTQGVRLVDVDIPQSVHKSGNTIHEMIQMFMDEGGVALVCPVCMVNVGGMETIDILPGVITGSPEFTWSAMFAENVTVLSY